MPIHDWKRVDAQTFHHFHEIWNETLSRMLNDAVLPTDYFATVEKPAPHPIPDILTLKITAHRGDTTNMHGGATVATLAKQKPAPRQDKPARTRRASRVSVRHQHGDMVAVIETVLPGDKNHYPEFRDFVNRSVDLYMQGVNLFVIDLFPPSTQASRGVHQAIWDELCEEDEQPLPCDKPFTVASLQASDECAAHVQCCNLGDLLPTIPLFLSHGLWVSAPLESAYSEAWGELPPRVKNLLEVS